MLEKGKQILYVCSVHILEKPNDHPCIQDILNPVTLTKEYDFCSSIKYLTGTLVLCDTVNGLKLGCVVSCKELEGRVPKKCIIGAIDSLSVVQKRIRELEKCREEYAKSRNCCENIKKKVKENCSENDIEDIVRKVLNEVLDDAINGLGLQIHIKNR